MTYTAYFILFFVAFILVIWWQKSWEENNKEKKFLENNFDALDHVKPFETNSLLAINKDKTEIFLNDHKGTNIIPIKDIVSLEVFENGNSIAKTNFTSQAGRIIVGGVLAGGIGAIIGGLSGSSTSYEKVKELSLKITTNNYENPNHKVLFIDKKMGSGIKKGSFLYNKAIEEIELWHSRITNLIKENQVSK